MNTAATKTDRPAPRRRLLPQFSLAAALIAMTACSVGLWYWYRVPFEVTHNEVRPYFLNDPLAPPFDTPPLKQIETVRRVWGGKTLRHGLLTTINPEGKTLGKEEYREGALNGKYERWHDDGARLVTGQFASGLPEGDWTYSLYFDPTMPPRTRRRFVDGRSQDLPFQGGLILGRYESIGPRRQVQFTEGECRLSWHRGLPDGVWQWIDPQGKMYLQMTFDKGRFISATPPLAATYVNDLLTLVDGEEARAATALLEPIHYQFVNIPLKDALKSCWRSPYTNLIVDTRRLDEAGISIDTPITCRIENLPRIAALEEVYGRLPIASHYRYGALFVTPQATAVNWKDETGVSQIQPPKGSAMAEYWEHVLDEFNVQAMPWELAVQSLVKDSSRPIAIDVSRLPLGVREWPITRYIHHVKFQNCLAILLDDAELTAHLDGETIVLEQLR